MYTQSLYSCWRRPQPECHCRDIAQGAHDRCCVLCNSQWDCSNSRQIDQSHHCRNQTRWDSKGCCCWISPDKHRRAESFEWIDLKSSCSSFLSYRFRSGPESLHSHRSQRLSDERLCQRRAVQASLAKCHPYSVGLNLLGKMNGYWSWRSFSMVASLKFRGLRPIRSLGPHSSWLVQRRVVVRARSTTIGDGRGKPICWLQGGPFLFPTQIKVNT